MSRIQALAAQLKFTYIRDNAETLIKEARHIKQDYTDFLSELLVGEFERRL